MYKIRTYFLLFSFLVFAVLGCKSSKKGKVKAEQKVSTHKSKPQKGESDNDVSDLRKGLVKTARTYIGTGYKYGGTNRAGLDCSGLMLITFKAHEIALPRNSAAQAETGISVGVDDLLPGDLLFFSEKKGVKKISHVGMVTEVKDDVVKFIHSTTKLGVVENNLHSDVYWPIFIKARRVCK